MILVSFCSILENMRKGINSDDRSASAIETGMGIDEDFWEKFLRLLNNSDGLSDLLDIPQSKIATWHQKIKAAKKKRDEDLESKPLGKNKKLI